MSSESGLRRMQQKCPTIASDWRSKDFRWKLFQRILDTFKKLNPGEDSKKLAMLATNFEHGCFSTSSSQEEYVSKIQSKLTNTPNSQKSAAVDGNKSILFPVQGPSVKKEEVEEKPSVNLSIEQQLRKQHQPSIPVDYTNLLGSKFPKEQASDALHANAMRSHSKSIQRPVQAKVNKQVNQHSTCGMQHQSKLLQGHQNVPVDLKHQNLSRQQSLQRVSQEVKVKSESKAHPYVLSLSKHPHQSQSQSLNLHMQRHSDSLQNSTLPQKQLTLTKKIHLEASSSQVVVNTNNVTPLGGDEAEEVYQKLQSFRPYLPELQAFYYSTVRSLQQMALSFAAEEHSKYESHKRLTDNLRNTIKCLMLSKDRIHPGLKEKLHEFDTNIPKIITHWRKMNDKSDQNIKPNVQVESTSVDSNTSLIQALQLPVEKLNNSTISSSQFFSNFSPQNNQSNAEIPSPFTASPSPATGLHTQSSASFTPGMHPSPLLAESTASETSQSKTAEAHVDELREKEAPMDKLKRLIKSLSADTLRTAVTDIRRVVSLTDPLHGCNPNYMVGKNKAGSKCDIRKDLSLSAKCHVQSENVMPQYMVRKRKNNPDIASVSPVHDDSDLRNYDVCTSEEQTTVSSTAKRQKCEINRSLQEEILKINQKLFNTEVEIEENVADYAKVELSAVGEGTVIKCSFTPITYSSDMKVLLSSSECQIKPLSLHIPSSYPNGSPVLLTQLTDAELHEDNLNGKIQSRVEGSIGCISHPASLEEIVSTWNSIVHDVVIESLGGCTFTSYYGTWQKTGSE